MIQHLVWSLSLSRQGLLRSIESIRAAGFRVQDVRTREPSLEDIFVELTADQEVPA